MPLNFGRAHGAAEIEIDKDRCTLCGLCVKVCRGAPLFIENGEVRVDQSRLFGCIGCGQCAAVCPENCIRIMGRDFSPEDIIDNLSSERPNYDQLKSLIMSRRSVRDFRTDEVEREVIERILETASFAPMGVPPSEVGVLIADGRTKVRQLKDDMLSSVRKAKWMLSPWMLKLMRPMLAKEGYETFKAFVVPVTDFYIESDKEGKDWFLYDAPLAVFFYGSAYADPADSLVAATYAMLAAESLGLGTCMLGFPGYILKYSKDLKAKYGLPAKMQPGILIIFGYPEVKYRRAIKRRFAKVEYMK